MNKTYTDEETLAIWEQFVAELVATPTIQAFQQAESKIATHERISAIRSAIKLEQKAMVNAKHYEKFEAVALHQANIDAFEAELELIPLWHQYADLKVEVNTIIQEIIQEVESV